MMKTADYDDLLYPVSLFSFSLPLPNSFLFLNHEFKSFRSRDFRDFQDRRNQFAKLTPKIAKLVTNLKDVCPFAIPLLQRQNNQSITLSQAQVVVLQLGFISDSFYIILS